MKKSSKIILLFLVFTLLTTYNPNQFFTLSKNFFFFKVQNIKIVNNNLIKTSSIEEKIAKIYGTNILFLKRNDVESLLNPIDFLEKIEVKKKYPATLIIKIYETKPIAILHNKGTKYFLDSSFKLIHFNNNSNFNTLPNIFGDEAEKYFANFLKKLKNYDFKTERVKNYYYFQIGRWDLQLNNNQIIKLPSNGTSEAIQRIGELLEREDFQKYNIIDLRIDGKIVVE